jgi:membrane protein DedA with SNARE-associated domain
MEGLLAWLSSLPLVSFYAALALIAAVENVFPPVPADTMAAFGSFVTGRGHGSPVVAFLAVWTGNMLGAAFTYGLGRRFGASRVEHYAKGRAGTRAKRRLESLYGRFGMAALFVSRFLPGVRALVPPFAGALGIPPVRAMAIIGIASGIWYGVIAAVSFRVGESWEDVLAALSGRGMLAGAVAVVLMMAMAVYWWARRPR